MADDYKRIFNKIIDDFVAYITGEGYEVQKADEAGFSEPDDTVWCRVTLIPGGAETMGIGAQITYRMAGVVDVQIFNPAGSDEDNTRGFQGSLMDNYAFKNIATDDPGTIIVARFLAPYPVDLGRVKGKRQNNVTFPFDVDFYKRVS